MMMLPFHVVCLVNTIHYTVCSIHLQIYCTTSHHTSAKRGLKLKKSRDHQPWLAVVYTPPTYKLDVLRTCDATDLGNCIYYSLWLT